MPIRVQAFYTTASTGNTFVSNNIGYSSASVASPDTTAEILFDNATTSNLTLKASWVNPTPGIPSSNFVSTGTYLVNYSTNSGQVQVYGDYTVSGSTLTLDYATQLYASSATTPKTMRGSGWTTLRVDSTNDANAASQLVTVTWDGAKL